MTSHSRKTIVIRENDNPVSYVLGKTVHYVDKAGKEIDRHVIQPGKRVILHYTGTGEKRRVERGSSGLGRQRFVTRESSGTHR